MDRHAVLARWFALAGAVGLLGLLLGIVWMGAEAAPAGGTLRLAWGEPGRLDPALASDGNELRVVAQIFEGLVRSDNDLAPQPALAAGWSVSPDGSVYTFTLAAAAFSNGRPVVASDLVFSFMRALSPTLDGGNPAPYASMLYDIQGAEAYNSGDTGVPVGIHALDAATVRFDLIGPVPPGVFLHKLALPIASVVAQEEIAAGGPEWWRDPEHCIGTGPFKLAGWAAGDRLWLAPNGLHHAGRPSLRGIVVRFLSAADALEAYRQDQVDLFEPDASQVKEILADPVLAGEFITRTGTCTFWSILDNQAEPFQGELGMKLRQAFNHAVDKDEFVAVAWGGLAMPARGVLPPGMYGYNPDLQGLDFDPGLAVQLLAESGYAGTPEIVLRHSDTPGALLIAQTLRDQIFAVLGVSVTLSTTAPSYQMRVHGWCADYPDPSNWLPLLLRTGAPFNRTHYSNPQVDTWLDQAAVTLDEGERIALYQQAEQLAVSEAAELPLYHNQWRLLKKPGVSEQAIVDLQWWQPFDDVMTSRREVYLPLVLRGYAPPPP